MMTEALQLLTVVATALVLAIWGLNQGRKERRAENHLEGQRSIDFPTQQEDSEREHQGVAMSRLR
jgi:hypothetical protein